jgi:hypothetical protein
VHAVNDMLGNGGQKSQVKGAILTDEEFDDIQRRHYGTGCESASKFDPDRRPILTLADGVKGQCVQQVR